MNYGAATLKNADLRIRLEMKGYLSRLDCLLLMIGISLLPIYIFGSGGVQPAHVVLALFAGVTLVTRGVPLTDWSLLLLFISCYTMLVEGVYVAGSNEPGALLNSVYYFYNYLLSIAIYQHVRNLGLGPLVTGVLIASGVALVAVLITGVDLREIGEAGRPTGTFNNPNQLGYFSVCLLSIAYLLHRERQIRFYVALGIFTVSIYLAVVSLSKAAMVANFAVVVFALMPRSSGRYAKWAWISASVGAVICVLLLSPASRLDEYLFMQRLARMFTENDSSLEARGYLAFLEGDPAQWIFGLGSLGVDEIVGKEVHSTLGSVLNNYGIIGFLLASLFFGLWALRLLQNFNLIGLVCISGPAMLYGLTHNGSRFTIFWVLVSASMAAATNLRDRRIAQRVNGTSASAHKRGRDSGNSFVIGNDCN